ncbi:MAG: hypothetical protein JO248_18860 [Acidimicrobiia bacterium]|nr:hypothetical protein [Acidimicrobiia bacterium]
MSSTRRMRALAYVVVGLLLAGVFGIRVASAARADDTTLGSYSAIAAAPGMEFTEDEPSAQAHPEGQGDVPYTTSILTNGGVGYALSSIAWPGAYGGNAGSLVLVALPSAVGPIPRPDAVTSLVQTVSPALQYPIRAEARAGTAPDASYGQIPGTTLTSHADANNVHAVADVKSAQQSGVNYGNMHSDSSSTLDGNSVKTLADSVIQNIDIGGVVKIKSLISTATATTDGSNSSANGATLLQGLTVGGQPATLDQGGLHVGSSSSPLNATAAAAANQALTNLGMKVYVSQPITERNAGSITYQASSIVWTWVPPSDPSKNVFILTLGGSRVSVAAGEGFGQPSESGDSGAGATSGDTGGGTSVLGSGVSGSTSAPLGSVGTSSSGTFGTRSVGRGATQNIGGVNIAKTFDGFGAIWIVVALAGAGLAGFGCWRLLAELVDKPPATCPLEVPR